MKVLIVGSGGREHALTWKLSQSERVQKLYCAPGNPGMAAMAELVAIGGGDLERLADFAAGESIDLTVVGPEAPLAAGIVDLFRARGLAAFGPVRAAARLESSKVFAKEFMVRHGIPTAEPFAIADDEASARLAARTVGLPLVLKADGLAAGKGVLLVRDERELDESLAVFFEENRFGAAGARIVVEPLLEGEEVSFMGLSDGRRVLPLATSKDYKRIGENDTGPNTGGMGAHSPALVVSTAEEEALVETVLERAVHGMAADGHSLVGVVYAGLMMTADGPRVLEYNLRFGDPEAQPLLMRLDDDLGCLLWEAAGDGFERVTLDFSERAAACVVLGNEGYPGEPVTGDRIEGLEDAAALEDVEVFHAGTAAGEEGLLATGGRVLDVCALGSDVRDALARAYVACDRIHWPHKILRRDIGRRVTAEAG